MTYFRTLTEYGAVSAEPPASHTSGSPAAAAVDESRPTGIDVRSLEWMRPLLGDYVYNFQHCRRALRRQSRFAQAPGLRPSRDRTPIDGIRQSPQSSPRSRCVAGAPARSREAAALACRSETVVIATGQQAGAFGGPLFTLLKAVTAIQLAARSRPTTAFRLYRCSGWTPRTTTGKKCARARCSTAIFSREPSRWRIPRGPARLPVAQLRLDERIVELRRRARCTRCRRPTSRHQVIDRNPRRVSAGRGNGGGLLDVDRNRARPARTRRVRVGRSCSQAARRPGVRPRAGIARVAPRRSRRRGRRTLAALGHQPQVASQPDSISLFHLNGARQPIRRDGDRFLIGDTAVTPASLVEEARTSPERFSPNVLLRPLVQDTLFPTDLLRRRDRASLPISVSCAASTITSASRCRSSIRAPARRSSTAPRRGFSRATTSRSTISDRATSRRSITCCSRSCRPKSSTSLKHAEETLRSALQRVIDAMPALDPTLAGAAKTTMGKMEHDLKSLHGKVIQAAKRRDETLRRQFTRAQAQIFPLGHPQERTLTLVYFLNRYGPGLVDTLLRTLPLEMGKHWVVTL